MGIAFNPSVATVPNQNASAEVNPVGKGTHLSPAEQTALNGVVKETAAKKLDFGGDNDSQAAKTLHIKQSTDKPADSATTEGALRWAQNVNGKDPEAVQVFLDRLQFADPKAYDYISNYLGIQAKGETSFGKDADSQAAKRISRRSVGDPPADSATVDGALRWAQNVNGKDPAAVQEVLDKVQATDRKAYDYMSNMLGIQATGELWFGPDDDAQAAKRLYRKSAGDPSADAETKEGALRWLNSVRDPDVAANYLAAVKTNDPAAYEYVSHYSSKIAAGQKTIAVAADRVANATSSKDVAAAESDLNQTINTTIADLQARNVELEAVYKQNSTQRAIGRGNYQQAPANEAGKAAANEIQDNNKLIEGLKNATLPTFIGTGAVAGPGGFGPPPPKGYVAPPALPPGTDLKTAVAHLTPDQAKYLGWSIGQGILKKQVQVPADDVQNWNTLANWQRQNNDYFAHPTTEEPPAANTGRVVADGASLEYAKNLKNHEVAMGAYEVFHQMPESAGQTILGVLEAASMFIPLPGLDALGAAIKVGKEAAGSAIRGARSALGAGAEGIAGASGKAARPLGGLETSGDIVVKQGSAEARAGGSETGSVVEPADKIAPPRKGPTPVSGALPRISLSPAETQMVKRSGVAVSDAAKAGKNAEQAASDAEAAAHRAAKTTDPKVAAQEAAKAKDAADEAARQAKAADDAFDAAATESFKARTASADAKALTGENALFANDQAEAAKAAATKAQAAAKEARASADRLQPPPAPGPLPRLALTAAESRMVQRSGAAASDATKAGKKAEIAMSDAKTAARRASQTTDPKVAEVEAAKAHAAAEEAVAQAKAADDASKAAADESAKAKSAGPDAQAIAKESAAHAGEQAKAAEEAAKKAQAAAKLAGLSAAFLKDPGAAKRAVADAKSVSAEAKKMVRNLDLWIKSIKSKPDQRANVEDLMTARAEVLAMQKRLSQHGSVSTPERAALLVNDTNLAREANARALSVNHRVAVNGPRPFTAPGSVVGDEAYLANPAAQPAAGPGWEVRSFADRSLFGPSNKLSLDDAKQGGLGSCWFDSALQDMAVKHPQMIRDGIRSEGAGTYKVYLHDSQGKGHWIGVDSHFPVRSNGDLANAGQGGQALWAALYEKAAAKMASYDKATVFKPADKTGYAAIDGDYSHNAAQMLLGPKYSAQELVYHNGNMHMSGMDPLGDGRALIDLGPIVSDKFVRRMLATDINERHAIATVAFDKNAPPGMVVKHAYSIAAITPEGNMVVRNPHGGSTFEVPLSELNNETANIGLFALKT